MPPLPGAAKKVHKLQKASKVPAMPSDHPLIAPGPDVPTPTAPPAEPPAPPSDPPGDADCAEEQGLVLEQIWTTGACTEADSGSVGPPAPPCSPCTKALTLAHHLALLTVFVSACVGRLRASRVDSVEASQEWKQVETDTRDVDPSAWK
ncbi:hypothetical protein FB451DRAFT_1552427 [Mycena latifolia]|nr:hypothetical protein FB451DRAFT_1552427 [Mycena latifolia]